MSIRHRNGLSWYNVLSPEYTYVEPVMDFGQGPTYSDHDWLCVEAHTRSEAKARAVRYWTRSNAAYIRELGENPYKGVTVSPHIDPHEEAEEEKTGEYYLPYEGGTGE